MGRYLYMVLDEVALLIGFVLAFGAITIIWRPHWVSFGPAESLLARLAAAGVLAMVALAGVAQYLFQAIGTLQSGSFESPIEPGQGRTQAFAVGLGTLALAVIAVLRIELYHRRVTGVNRRESDEEWQTEEPAEKRAPRDR
jgi:hypothetical protein